MTGSGNTYRNKKAKGDDAESKVEALLLSQGFSILQRNWRTPFCEVDLVAFKNQTLFIFEIKSREKKSKFPAISFKQRERLSRGALWIWQKNRLRFKFFKCKQVLVTQGNIDIGNLPLLYDTT